MKNTSEIIWKEALLSVIWCEDSQMTNKGKVYNPKYLVDSADETVCCESLPLWAWTVWMYTHDSCVSYV